MPITINGVTDARVGRIQSVLSAFTSDFDGTHVAPGDVVGSMNPTLGAFTTDFDGVFVNTTSDTDGDVNFTLGGFSSRFLGNQIQNVDGQMSTTIGGFATRFQQEQLGDWTSRSTASGVVYANNFATQAQIDENLDPVPNNPLYLETAVTKSGGGALKMGITKTQTTTHGEWDINYFTDNHALAAGEEIYVQYRQYWPAYMIDHVFKGSRPDGTSQGFKSVIFSQTWPDGSFTNSEIVMQERVQTGFMSGYHQDGAITAFHWTAYQNVNTACDSSDDPRQPAIDRGVQTNTPAAYGPPDQPGSVRGQACLDDSARYGALQSYLNEGAGVRGRADPVSGGVPIHKYGGVGNWVTIYNRIKIGAAGQGSSTNEWESWFAHDGDPYTLLFSENGVDLGSSPNYGLNLSCYRSNGQSDPTRRDTYTVYDELIISTDPIAAPSEPTTALRTVVEGMSAGEWAEVNTIGFDSSLPLTWGDQAFDYSHTWVWDHIKNQGHFIGGGHQDPIHHIVYDEASNTWTTINSNLPGQSHGYDHMAIDVDRRKLYRRQTDRAWFEIYDLDDQTWTVSSNWPWLKQQSGGMTYNEHLGMAQIFDSRSGILSYDLNGDVLGTPDTWQQTLDESFTDQINPGPIHIAAEYSPRYRATVFGGGNNSVGVGMLDMDGGFTHLADAPSVFGPASSCFTHDPVTGFFLILNAVGLYEMRPDVSNGAWSLVMTRAQIEAQGASFLYQSAEVGGDAWNLVCCACYTHGVTLWAKHNDSGTTGQLWVYRHA